MFCSTRLGAWLVAGLASVISIIQSSSDSGFRALQYFNTKVRKGNERTSEPSYGGLSRKNCCA